MSLAPVRFAIYLVIVFLVLSTVTLFPGVFRVSGHEIDLAQALDISYRMADGLIPHLDFMTPLGALAFQPIAWFLEAGHGPGRSYLLANIAVTLVMLPGIWWVGMSRLGGAVRMTYGIGMIVLGLSMIYGGAGAAITASMYYNRWAWIPASWVVLLLMLPPRAGWRSPLIDGLLIGVAAGALVLVKVTYVLALLPFALRVILSEAQWRVFGWALASALSVLVWATLTYGGIALWPAYIGDLLAVALESERSKPGLEWSDLLASASTISMSLLLLLVIVFWRRCRMKSAGLTMFLLAPGWIYITYQNWGNDPKWLFLLALILLTRLPPEEARPFWGVPPRAFSKILAAISLVLFAPSMLTMSTSMFRHASKESTGNVVLFKDLSRGDIEVGVIRAYNGSVQLPYDALTLPASLEASEEDEAESKPDPVVLNGETLEECNLSTGYVGWMHQAVEQLGAVEEAVGKQVMVADIYDQLWMFGPFARVDSMAPWYYGTTDGFDTFEYMLVPHCVASVDSRRQKLEQIETRGWTLDEVIRTDLFILLRVER